MYSNYQRQQEVLHSPFDILTHKQTFTNYLEVLIDKEGVVHYAVPSHQEFAINYLVKNKYGTRDDLDAAVPREYWFDMMTWLSKESGLIFVWNNAYRGEANDKQIEKLNELKSAGLYSGDI